MAQEFRQRFSDREVAEILDQAATAPIERPAGQRLDGLTLDQIQEIASEIGLPPARVAQAAARVVQRSRTAPGPKRVLGRRRSVERVVHLEHRLSDEAWSRFVVDLREAFGTEGQVASQGSLRSWTAPNVAVHVEPDGAGSQVRMQVTNHEVAEHFLAAGALLLLTVASGMAAASGEIAGAGVPVLSGLAAIAGAGGAAFLARGWRRLPRWARSRAATLEELIHRLGR